MVLETLNSTPRSHTNLFSFPSASVSIWIFHILHGKFDKTWFSSAPFEILNPLNLYFLVDREIS
jgi:hypothetical protein